MTSPSAERLTRKDLWSVFWRSFLVRAANSPDRMQALGYTISMVPVINKYHKKPEERAEIYKRYLNEYFLTQPMMATWIIGISAAIEERIATARDVSRDTVTAIKTALMGPFAALGDGLINGTLRPIMAGVACSLALQGNWLGPILFLLVMGAVDIGVRWSGIFVGYQQGTSFFEKLQASGVVQRITEAASVVALIAVGAFSATSVKVKLAWQWTPQGAKQPTTMQGILDGLVPNLLPLCLTLFTWYLIEKKRVSPVTLIVVYLLAGIVGAYAGVFA